MFKAVIHRFCPGANTATAKIKSSNSSLLNWTAVHHKPNGVVARGTPHPAKTICSKNQSVNDIFLAFNDILYQNLPCYVSQNSLLHIHSSSQTHLLLSGVQVHRNSYRMKTKSFLYNGGGAYWCHISMCIHFLFFHFIRVPRQIVFLKILLPSYLQFSVSVWYLI
jgi:hypothetical protein